MIDHTSFFVESVSAVVEVKSNFTTREFDECTRRCSQLRHMSFQIDPGGIELALHHEVEQLSSRLAAAEAGAEWGGMMYAEPRMPYVVIFLTGGESVRIADLVADDDDIHDNFPSAICFLSAGQFVRRWEPSALEHDDGELPLITRYGCGEESLMYVADELLRLIRLRTPGLRNMWDLGAYMAFDRDEHRVEQRSFKLTHFPYGHRWL
jgi:hypothetical protein